MDTAKPKPSPGDGSNKRQGALRGQTESRVRAAIFHPSTFAQKLAYLCDMLLGNV